MRGKKFKFSIISSLNHKRQLVIFNSVPEVHSAKLRSKELVVERVSGPAETSDDSDAEVSVFVDNPLAKGLIC